MDASDAPPPPPHCCQVETVGNHAAKPQNGTPPLFSPCLTDLKIWSFKSRNFDKDQPLSNAFNTPVM